MTVARRTVVVGAVLVGLSTVAVGAATWVVAVAPTPLDPGLEVRVPGTTVAPVVAAAGLVGAAAGLALSLAGRVGARLVALVLLGGALLTGASASRVLADPATVAGSAVQQAVGVDVVDGVWTAAAPWLALVCAAVSGGLAVLVAVSGGAWARPERHDAARGAAPGQDPEAGGVGAAAGDDAEVWDALSRGEDPT